MSSSAFNRRSMIKRSAAAGLVAAPGATILSACATGGGGDDSGGDKKAGGPKGKKSDKNPLGVDPKAPLDVVIFDGGFGHQYAKDAEKIYAENYPDAKITHTATVEIKQKLQPRFAGGNPPDLIDNSGAQSMDTAGLGTKGELQDLNELLDMPSYDDPGTKVRDTLRDGVVEQGKLGGDEVFIMNYAYTVYGLWYSKKLLDDKGWEYPETWDDMMKLCAVIKKDGMAPFTYAGKHPGYIHMTLLPMIGKIGGQDVVKNIDNLEDGAWKDPAVLAAAEAYAELAAKDYILKGSPGLDHIQSQTKWTEGKAVFIPNGSWVANEAKDTTPDDFQMAVGAPQGLDSSDKLPFGTHNSGPSEPFIVPKKGKNPRGGMELLRIMLGKDSSEAFGKMVNSLTAREGEVSDDSPETVKSANQILELAGGPENIIVARYPGWYKQMKDAVEAGTAELMAGRIKPAEWVKRAQKAADDIKKDDSIKKITR